MSYVYLYGMDVEEAIHTPLKKHKRWSLHDIGRAERNGIKKNTFKNGVRMGLALKKRQKGRFTVGFEDITG